MITYVIYKIINYRYRYFSKICKKAFYFIFFKKREPAFYFTRKRKVILKLSNVVNKVASWECGM